MKVRGAASAGTLAVLCLIGTVGPAAAAPAPAQPAQSTATLYPQHGFQRVATSFVSPTWGVVLGGVHYTAGLSSRAGLEVTADGGTRWSVMRAPAVWLASPSVQSWLPQVSNVLFANRADGWLYGGNTVWATHNGGASWREITMSGNVQTMAVTGHTVYAVIQRSGTGRLYRSPLTWNAWTRVNPYPWYGPMTGSVLAVSGNSVWFASSTSLWTTADGVHWAKYGLLAPGTYNGHPYTLTGISAASPRIVTFLWAAPTGVFRTGTKVQVSFNGGRSMWQTRTAPPSLGNVAGFAMTPGGYGVISIAVVTPGADYVYRSVDLGQHWTTVALPRTGGGVMVNSLQFMSPATGCLVVGIPVATMLWTKNAGNTWYPVRI